MQKSLQKGHRTKSGRSQETFQPRREALACMLCIYMVKPAWVRHLLPSSSMVRTTEVNSPGCCRKVVVLLHLEILNYPRYLYEKGENRALFVPSQLVFRWEDRYASFLQEFRFTYLLCLTLDACLSLPESAEMDTDETLTSPVWIKRPAPGAEKEMCSLNEPHVCSFKKDMGGCLSIGRGMKQEWKLQLSQSSRNQKMPLQSYSNQTKKDTDVAAGRWKCSGLVQVLSSWFGGVSSPKWQPILSDPSNQFPRWWVWSKLCVTDCF